MNFLIAVTCFVTITVSWVAPTTTVREPGLPKCCYVTEVFENVEGAYKCVEDETRRLQVNTEETGFWYQNGTGECVEILDGNFDVFNVSDKVIQNKKQAKDRIYPKCCPLNYVYNPLVRSCEELQHLNHSYLEETLLKIGLPSCKIIVDHVLKDRTDFEYRNSELYLHRRNAVNSLHSYCVDQTLEGDFALRECKDDIEVCDEIRCFRKCCPDGQSFIDGDTCYDTYKYGFNVSKWANVIENHEGKQH